MKITPIVLLLGIIALGTSLYTGSILIEKFTKETPVLIGPEIAQETVLRLNQILTEFSDIQLNYKTSTGIRNSEAGYSVFWPKSHISLEDTPRDIVLQLSVLSLPFPLERETEEVCVWNNTVCFFPPKNIPYCLMPGEQPNNEWCYHPAMGKDNQHHPGISHPAALFISTNLKGLLEYPSYFEEKYQTRVFSRP